MKKKLENEYYRPQGNSVKNFEINFSAGNFRFYLSIKLFSTIKITEPRQRQIYINAV